MYKIKNNNALQLSITKNRDEFLIRNGPHKIAMRYHEISCEQERVEAELHLKLEVSIDSVLANQWVKLLNVYCHNSQDGECRLELKHGELFDTVCRAAIKALKLDMNESEFLRYCVVHTPYKKGFELLIDDLDNSIWDNIIVLKKRG